MWGNTTKSNIHKLQLVQNFAARIVLGLRKFDHISEGRKSLKWLNVSEKILFNDLVLAFKCINGLVPEYLSNYFVKRSSIHSRNTRGSGDLNIPLCRLSTGQRGFYFRGVRQWNNLTKDLQDVKHLNNFKKRLSNSIFNKNIRLN